MNATSRALLLLAALCPAVVTAQAPRPAVVVQVAGSTLYLDLGTDAGMRTGDTVAVRRSETGPILGALHVIAATARRSVLDFVGAPFPVTRGDTLFVTPRRTTDAVPAAAAIVTAPARAPPPSVSGGSVSRPRVDGAVGLEMWGSHSETIGLGGDPARLTRDVAMPTLRLQTAVTGERSRFRLALRAQQRTGPPTLWDRQARLRLYEARYDLTAGRTQLTLGRFFSDFDHQSAFWDGASLRVAVGGGFSVGTAAGYEPARGNEEPTFTAPKVAAFLGNRYAGGTVDLTTDVAVTQTLPRDRSLRRIGADLGLRLRVGRFTLSQDLEAAPPAPGLGWEVSRFLLRGSLPVGTRGFAYATAVTDRFTPLDTALLVAFTRRERVTAGYSVSLKRGAFVDVNASVNQPGDSLQGYAAGTTVSVPRVLGGTIALHTTWFDDGQGSGLLASPSFEYALGATRLRGGYQFYRVTQPAYASTLHGVDLRAWRPLGARVSGVLHVSERLGGNVRSTTVFTSVEWRF